MRKWIRILVATILVILAFTSTLLIVTLTRFSFLSLGVAIILYGVIAMILMLSLFFLYQLYKNKVKKKGMIGMSIFSIILLPIFILLLLIIGKAFRTLDNITDQKFIYQSTIIVRKESKYQELKDLKNQKVGVSSDQSSYENYKLVHQLLAEKDVPVTEIPYANYHLAIKDLLDGKIEALAISPAYLTLYSGDFKETELARLRALIDPVETIVLKKDKIKGNIDKPFSFLIIGADNETSSYNADTLVLATIDPIKKKILLVDLERDAYVYNTCSKVKDKITHTGWGGPECSLATVSKLFDIKLDYYIKFDFSGFQEVVDTVGGLTLDVPYSYPIAYKGLPKYTVPAGVQKLNGIETLSLARTRMVPGSSVETRGKLQMQIIEEITKQVSPSFVIKQMDELLNLLGTHINTNMSASTVSLLAQKYVASKNEFTFDTYTIKGTDYWYYHPVLNYTVVSYLYKENSLKEATNRVHQYLNIK